MDAIASKGPLRIRLEIGRGELERARSAAGRRGAFAPSARFDQSHLRGRLLIDLDAPLEPDPMLEFLRHKGALAASGPVSAALDLPVAYAVGQLAGACVMALHGEGEFTIPLTGGRGALTVAAEGGELLLGVPLEAYAAVARVPSGAGARAVAQACSELTTALEGDEDLRRWPLVEFLRREAAILAGESAPAGARQPTQRAVWPADRYAACGEPTVASLAGAAEAAGAHVVPYWKATRGAGQGRIDFEPLRAPGQARHRGALARFIFPGNDEVLGPAIDGDREATGRLVARLAKPRPFAAEFAGAALVRLREPSDALPMA